LVTAPAVDEHTIAGILPIPAPQVDWRLNLTALWVAVFLAVTGMSFTLPFMPLFLTKELGVAPGPQLAIWTGVVSGALGAGLFIASPLWGLVADRYGRKLMMLRAIFVGAIAVGLVGFARGPLDVTALRFLYGAAAAVYPVGIAIVAMETPRLHVGWAVGVLSSAVAVAGAAGPVLGSLGVSAFGLRNVFFLSAGMFLLAGVPVLLLVKERRINRSPTGSRGTGLAFLGRGRASKPLVAAIAALLVGQVLVSTIGNSALILIVLRLLVLAAPHVAIVTGLTFGASGVATAIAAITYSRLATRVGYRWVLVSGAGVLVLTFLGLAIAPSLGLFVVLAVLFGLWNGVLNPAVATLLGLEAPDEIKGTVFGLSSSAGAAGILIGPLAAGFSAASFGSAAAFIVVAGMATAMAALGVLWIREPPRHQTAMAT
jgi:MFS family permease